MWMVETHSPAVSLRYLLDGQSHLVAEVAAGVHHSERSFTQNHPLSVLVVLVVVLNTTRERFKDGRLKTLCFYVF